MCLSYEEKEEREKENRRKNQSGTLQRFLFHIKRGTAHTLSLSHTHTHTCKVRQQQQ